MRDVAPLDLSNPQHRGLVYDVALANARHLLNDHDNDIPLIIHYYHARQQAGSVYPFIALVDGEQSGCFWLEVDSYEIGRVRGALLPEYRDTWNAAYFMRFLVSFGFETLGLRKLDCELALYNKRDRESAAAERLLKHIGFKKRAILPEALIINGQPNDTILLDFLKRDYDVQKERE